MAALAALELTGRILVVLGPDDGIPDRSFANLRDVQTMQSTELNAYDVLKSDFVVFSDATLPGETDPRAGQARGGSPQGPERIEEPRCRGQEPTTTADRRGQRRRQPTDTENDGSDG